MKINECVSACEDLVTDMCSIDEPSRDLNDDCILKCSKSSEWSFVNGTLIGVELIASNGCDRYFQPVENDVKMTADELAKLAMICVGVLVFLVVAPAILPKPIMI